MDLFFVSLSQTAKIEKIILTLYYLKKQRGRKIMKLCTKLLRLGHPQQIQESTYACVRLSPH